jgi:hypothetical protein
MKDCLDFAIVSHHQKGVGVNRCKIGSINIINSTLNHYGRERI